MYHLPKIVSDVAVSVSKVPNDLDAVIAQGVLWQVADRRFLLDVPGAARYLVEDGSRILIEPYRDAPERCIGRHLGLLPLAALLYQRGLLAFHAAAATDGERAILICGDSGCGKSTLLAALLQRGWGMLGDDLAVVGLDGEGRPTVYPAGTGVALWQIALEQLGIDSLSIEPCDPNRRLYLPTGGIEKPSYLLDALYQLDVRVVREVELADIAGTARFGRIGTMVYNSRIADALCSRIDYFRLAGALAQNVKFRQLHRPRGSWRADALADAIIADCSSRRDAGR